VDKLELCYDRLVDGRCLFKLVIVRRIPGLSELDGGGVQFGS
jgi:hypothetical protein